jgi:membrane protein DedA with SNARE-associated domain
MMHQIGQLIIDYGYLIVGVFIFFEGMAIPFPTDTTVITAAAFAAHGRLSVGILFIVSTLTAAGGTTIAFVAGRRGSTFFERHSRRVSPAVLARTRGFFDRHGGTAVVVGRFVPIARMLISPMAGLSTMSLARFTLFNLTGAALWSAVFCGLGFFFGQHPPDFGPGLARAAVIVTVGLALLVTVAVAGGWLVEGSDAAWRAEGTMLHRVLTTAPVRWLATHSPRARAFLFRRFSAADYLGLNLTIGLGLSFVALVIFSALMNTLLANDAVPQFDLALASALRESATPRADALWRAVSELGRFPLMLVPGLALGLLLVRHRGWMPLAGWTSAIVGALLLDGVMKHFFVHMHASASAARATEMVTPSGQALGALVGYGMLGYFVVLLAPTRRAAGIVVAVTLALVLAICFGRLFLGTRYFSDIISGLAAGGVWLSACITGLEVARRRAERDEREGSGRRRAAAGPPLG